MPRAPPRVDQRPGLPEHGVGVRHRDLGDVGNRAWPLVALAGAEIRTASVGIGADDEEIGARAFLLVADPGGTTTTSPARTATVSPLSPPKRTRAAPLAMPRTSCAVL